MSVSSNCNLYCTELAADVVSFNPDNFCGDDHHFQSFDCFSGVHGDDENYVVNNFNSEVDDQMQFGPQLLAKYRKHPELVSARQEAIKWMLKAGTGWQWQLLSVACLALAAKMEETSVPPLIDLQAMEPRYFFKPKTVQRMELIVMTSLKWRLRTVTPFDFLHYFISDCSRSTDPQRNGYSTDHSLLSSASDVVIRTSKVIDFLDYQPSTIAAAVVLWARNNHIIDDQKLGCFHKRLNKDMVRRCYNLIKRKMQVPFNGRLGVFFQGSCDAVKTRNYKEIKPSLDLTVPTNKCLKSGND